MQQQQGQDLGPAVAPTAKPKPLRRKYIAAVAKPRGIREEVKELADRFIDYEFTHAEYRYLVQQLGFRTRNTRKT